MQLHKLCSSLPYEVIFRLKSFISVSFKILKIIEQYIQSLNQENSLVVQNPLRMY